jgi:serine/threonine-protein kinase
MLEEARTAARIGHAAIVRTLDFGLTRLGDPFLVMELLHGEDLADLLARERRLPALAAVSTLLPIAHGLATAHEGGIIHRDVKPENIFLAATDLGTQPKLLDFGIARFTDRMQRLTLEGVVLGTPDYISPEQARGEKVTPAADLWSYCVVLYELVTGRCPFQGESYYELLRAIVEQAPAPLVAHGVNEPELWRLLARGLSKRPSDRYPTLRELGQALAEWAIARGLQEDVTGTSLRRTWLRDAEGSVPDRLPVGVEPGAAPGSGADPRRRCRREACCPVAEPVPVPRGRSPPTRCRRTRSWPPSRRSASSGTRRSVPPVEPAALGRGDRRPRRPGGPRCAPPALLGGPARARHRSVSAGLAAGPGDRRRA